MKSIIFFLKNGGLMFLWLSPLLIQAQNSQLLISFENYFGAKQLEFGKDYTNAHDEDLSFTLLNYYISNIQLIRTDGSVYSVPQDSSYFLITQEHAASRLISLFVPTGKYKSVSFMIGVDSLRSTQGADKRQGVLDVGAQGRGMYWVWNSGYIFFKMEGKSPASPDSLQNNFYYHIGGFGGFDKPTLNNIRNKKIDFKKPIKVAAQNTPMVTVKVDIEQFFDAMTPLKISENPSVMWGILSSKIADNYVGIFSLKGIDDKSKK